VAEKVLVTGCLGFVGRILTEKLLRAGYEVWGVDQSDGDDRYTGKLVPPNDLLTVKKAQELVDRAGPRYIVHLAAQSSAGRSFEEPQLTISNNVLPVLNLLDCLRTGKGQIRMLAVGSADVYGSVTKEDLPLRESMPPRPGNPYALSKAIQEQVCNQYVALYGVDVVSTRSFNHTGAGQRDTFVLPSFARQIVQIKQGQRKPRVEVGNVELKRDFSDVNDVCDAYIALLKKGRSGEVYNVCSGASYSLRELLEKLAAIAGVDVEIRVDKERVRPVDMEELRGDNNKIIGDARWAPRLSISETLRSLIEYWSQVDSPAGR
jgi:GDP-4-dehydro-6-deoxy-D-mannose reductase